MSSQKLSLYGAAIRGLLTGTSMQETGSVPGLDPQTRNSNPFQYSCWRVPLDRGLVGYSP